MEYYRSRETDLDQLPWNRRPIILYSQDPRAVEDYLREKDINPHFPYPVYLVCEEPFSSRYVNVIADERELPRYFLPAHSHKIEMLAEKVRNAPIQEGLHAIAQTREKTKRLFMLSRETQYYEDLLQFLEQSRG